jgi:energy-coupling factor transporter ATP-binding protein EcfA2
VKLLKFKLSGIKRFEEEAALTVGEQLVAIVGPNEAGKSTLLEAMWWIDHPDPLPDTLATRRVKPRPMPGLKALFALDEVDRAAIAGIHGGPAVERCWLEKTSLRARSWSLEHEPTRDLAPRRAMLARMLPFVDDLFLDPENSTSEETIWELERFETGLQVLGSDDDTLSEEDRSVLLDLADRFLAIEPPPPQPDEEGNLLPGELEHFDEAAIRRREAAVGLRELVSHELMPHPRDQIIAVLAERLPRFAKFAEQDRDLQNEYDLDEALSNPPPPLANLLHLAGLDIPTVHEASHDPDRGNIEHICEQGNKRLAEVFQDWDQSLATPRIRVDDSILRILVKAGPQIGWIPVQDRSDGLRWYLALRAFLHREGVENTVLLIDEIETHLHLGAQAGLIEILMSQRLAKQVVYTTHSPGALPPDLGTGVRAVLPGEGHRSTINNAFWASGPGFSPLLFAMGAATLPFAIPRELLIAEGASEAILLPTLLREAAETDTLTYRVAPGISNASAASLGLLDAEGGRVAYVVDGDGGGDELRDALLAAGIEGSRIHSLRDLTGEAATLEDLVTAEAYVDAVHVELRPYLDDDLPQVSDLGEIGRASKVKSWCSARSVSPPSKIRVAQHIVDAAHVNRSVPSPTLNALGRKALAELHQRLSSQLSVTVASAPDPED